MTHGMHVRSLSVALAATTLLMVGGCAAPPADPALWQRCNRDFALWARYNYNQAVNHTGQKLIADYALYECRQGRYHPAIERLEDILQRMKVPIPKS